MPNKMLIDASHPEETRVVVVRGNRIEEFDFESQDKKQLRGNIYLARVTRVEPSLQAAFVEYGGNRHGFLAFSEIHPDYYQIPVADRQALLRADAEAADAEEEEDEAEERGRRERRRGRSGRSRRSEADREQAREAAVAGEDAESGGTAVSGFDPEAPQGMLGDSTTAGESPAPTENAAADENPDEEHPAEEAPDNDESGDTPPMAARREGDDVISEPAILEPNGNGNGVQEVANGTNGEDEVESVGAEDVLEEVPSRRRQPRRQYKIQEVIKRRQILLVQVVKEERGNKGAALTTYLSLAGRYSVLMPNTARGGGISRKITNAQDRKRLKEVVSDLEVPQGMGVILRTAGANRTKAEIKRDYEYLMRLWENVRNLTLQSTAPALVYEEGSLIKRSVRDLYNKDIDEILVAGEEGYREAKDFMRMLMPSHAKMVQPYRDSIPIFARNGIEAQLDKMLQPQVTLKSGGYIIINQTEALVAIDVNSGRSTKEHSIEDTALQTNLEAAEEVARQLRLRDLAGLIVIDFIDMEENRNNRAVEKRLKDHLKNDRARIQVGRISHFGLLEMSRQRIRASVLESTMKPCPHCGGSGHVRSDSSVALHVVRAIEEFLLKDARNHITVRTPVATALYVLNHKRHNLTDLENRFGLTITIEADDSVGPQHYAITRGLPVERPVTPQPAAPMDVAVPELEEEEIESVEIDDDAEAEAESQQADEGHDDERGGRRRRRRRRRRSGREAGAQPQAGQPGEADAAADQDTESEDREAEEASESAADTDASGAETDGERKKRRRGKRGGRRNRRDEAMAGAMVEGDTGAEAGAGPESAPKLVESTAGVPTDTQEPAAADSPAGAETVSEAVAEVIPAEKPKRAPRRSTRPANEAPSAEQNAAAPEATMVSAADAAPEETPSEPPVAPRPVVTPSPAPVVTPSGDGAEAEPKPRKVGWWQRKGFF